MSVILGCVADTRSRRSALAAVSQAGGANEAFFAVWKKAKVSEGSHSRLVFKKSGEHVAAGANEKGLIVASIPAYFKAQGTGEGVVDALLSGCVAPLEAIERLEGFVREGGLSATLLIMNADEAYIVDVASRDFVVQAQDGLFAAAGECTANEARFGTLKTGDEFRKKYADKRAASRGGAMYRRFTALQGLFDAVNGEQIRDLGSLILGRDKRTDPVGLDILSTLSALRGHARQAGELESACIHNPLMRSSGIAFEPGVVWVSRGSVPCASLFVPVVIKGGYPVSDEDEAIARWRADEVVTRAVLDARTLDFESFVLSRNAAERRMFDVTRDALSMSKKRAVEVNAEVTGIAEDFFQKWRGECGEFLKNPARGAWKKVNAEFFGE